MTTISQKESVIQQVKLVLGSSFDPSVPVRNQLTDDQLDVIKANIFSGIMAGSIDFSKEITDEKELSRYVSGMVSNYLRKAKELNGGSTYAPQSTGRGSRDPQVAELSKLLKTYTEGSDEYTQISFAIDARKAELSSERTVVVKEKKKTKEFESINFDALPESLKNLVSNFKNQNS